MDALRLIKVLFKINFQMSLAYRTDTLVNMGLNLLWLAWELFSLQIIFSNTTTLAGWGPGELIALLGVFRLVNMLMAVLLWPATEKFNTSVRDGTLDYTLLLPADSLFLVSFSRITVWRLWEFLLALGLVVAGISMGGDIVTPLNLLYFLALVFSGGLVIYSLWVVLIALTFWFTKFDNNVTILQALLDAGRYPATVYPGWLRVIVTFIIPIALATTVPLQALRGELGGRNTLIFMLVGLASFVVAQQVWKYGVRRYSGASS